MRNMVKKLSAISALAVVSCANAPTVDVGEYGAEGMPSADAGDENDATPGGCPDGGQTMPVAVDAGADQCGESL